MEQSNVLPGSEASLDVYPLPPDPDRLSNVRGKAKAAVQKKELAKLIVERALEHLAKLDVTLQFRHRGRAGGSEILTPAVLVYHHCDAP